MDGGRKMNKKQYVPKIGDHVKLVELHKDDAHYDDMESLFSEVFVIDEIEQWHSTKYFPFSFARTHLRPKKSGTIYIFYAAKFAPTSKLFDTIHKWRNNDTRNN
jgi:hypothetical protein